MTGRGSPVRADALRAVVGEGAPVLGVADAPRRWDGIDAVVLDGPMLGLDAGAVKALRLHVEEGATLVAIGASEAGTSPAEVTDLLGVLPASPAAPAGEVFARPSSARGPLTRRIDEEFAIVDRVVPVPPRDGQLRPQLHVSIGFVDRPVLVEGHLGAGRLVVSGVGNTDLALRSAVLRTVLGRAVRLPAGVEERPLGVGVVGYGPHGGMGYSHGLAVAATEGLRLVAACDTSADRLVAAERDFPGLRPYHRAGDLAADPDVDIAIVATPPAHHAALALELLRAGKHVVCEKPLCLRLCDADELIDTARSCGRLLTAYQNRRWDTDFLALRHAVDAGLLGDLFNVETFVGGFEHPCRAWHSHDELSGGAVFDWGSHHVDWILQLLPGMPRSVSCVGHKRVWHDVTNLDQLRVRLTWEDGREAQFLQSDVAAVRPPKFFAQGTRGTLIGHYRELAFERLEPGRGYVRDRAHHAEAPADIVVRTYESGYGLVERRPPLAPEQRLAFHRNLADHLHLGDPLAVSVESVRGVVAVLEAATRSAAESGTPVALTEA